MKRTENDSWESLIRNNKEGFDNKPPRDLWENIESELPIDNIQKSKLINLFQVYKYAALFVIALGFGYLVMYMHFTSPESFSNTETVTNSEMKKEITKPEYVQELAEVENYYTSEIDDKLDELKTFENSEEVINELNLLQEEFEELQAEMGSHVNEEKIVRAMIQNYRIRLELLKEILKELNPDRVNKIRNYGNETI
jgi:hypothetical protein